MDTVTWFGVPCICYGKAILVEEHYNPVPERTDGWGVGPILMSSYDGRSLKFGQVADDSILIPAIASYLDALVYHRTKYRSCRPQLALVSGWQIRNLTRYLYLEQPKRRIEVLFNVEADTEKHLERYLATYKRKPRYVMLEGDLLQVEDCLDIKKGRVTEDHQVVPYPGLEYD